MSVRPLTQILEDDGSPFTLLNAFASAHGTVERVEQYNLHTKSTKDIRQFRVLLCSAYIGGIYVDHVWLFGCNSIKRLRNAPRGTRVTLTGKVVKYHYQDCARWALGFPYQNVSMDLQDR